MKRDSKLTIYSLLTLFLGLVMFMSSCNKLDDNLVQEEIITPDFEEINAFSKDDLKMMKATLEESGVEIDIDLDIEEEYEEDTRGLYIKSPFVKAIKVAAKTPHPNRSGSYIDVSGVVLVPNTLLAKLKTYRIVVVPPSTYTYNEYAPSKAFKKLISTGDEGHISFLYYWTLQAQSGYLVFIPDYPGFGDSHGQCFHPYMDSQALVNSTLDLLKAAKETLTANKYKYKNELVIAGYSLGGFVAASLAHEIETNSAHGYSASLLITGGTPCNIKYIADQILASDYTRGTYFLPYAFWGYKENAYPNLNVSDFLLEPYASTSKAYYDGTHLSLNDKFPHNPAELYTEEFRKETDTNAKFAYINQIIEENSVSAWKNSCKFVMTHGLDDQTVYYQNARDFADAQKNAGGKVTFLPTLGNHASAIIPFFTAAAGYLLVYR